MRVVLWEPRSSIPWDGGERGGGRSPKIFFRPLGPQFGLKMKGRPGPSRAPSLDPPLKKQTNKQIGEVFLSISLERLNNALFGKEITVGLWLGLLRNAISLVSNVYLLVHKNLGTAAYANRAHGFISYWSSGVDHTWRPASLNYGRTTRGQQSWSIGTFHSFTLNVCPK